LIGALPPSSLPAAEYSKFLEYFHRSASVHARGSPLVSVSGSPFSEAAREHPASRLLKRWFRQTKHAPSGRSEGDYNLVTPPELTDTRDSVFSPEAAANRLSRRQQMAAIARELRQLGLALATAALPALFPPPATVEEAPHAAETARADHAHVYSSQLALAAAARVSNGAGDEGGEGGEEGEGGEGGEGGEAGAQGSASKLACPPAAQLSVATEMLTGGSEEADLRGAAGAVSTAWLASP